MGSPDAVSSSTGTGASTPSALPRIVLAEPTSTSAPEVVSPAVTSMAVPVSGVGVPPTHSVANTGKNSKSCELKQTR